MSASLKRSLKDWVSEVIDKHPIELHITGYRGDDGVNGLDEYNKPSYITKNDNEPHAPNMKLFWSIVKNPQGN